MTQAEQEITRSLEIRRKLFVDNPDGAKAELVETLVNAAELHKRQNDVGRAQTELREAAALYRELAQKMPVVYEQNVVETEEKLRQLTK